MVIKEANPCEHTDHTTGEYDNQHTSSTTRPDGAATRCPQRQAPTVLGCPSSTNGRVQYTTYSTPLPFISYGSIFQRP